MEMLKKCRKAEVYDPSDTKLCVSEVFCDLSNQIWVSVSPDFPWEDYEYYNIIFFDPVAGLVRCQCTLGNPQETSEERLSLLCNILEVLESQQRRQDLKIPLEIDLEISCIEKPAGTPDLPASFTATTRNISAGGVYLICPIQLPEGAVIEFQLQGAAKPLFLTASILRSEKLPPKKNVPQYGHGCQYMEMKPKTEAALRNYIFRKQRERRF